MPIGFIATDTGDKGRLAQSAFQQEEKKNRQKIVIVTVKLDVGGTERHLVQVLPELNKELFDVEVITIYKGGALEATLRNKGVPVSSPRHRVRLFALIEVAVHLLIRMRSDRGATFHFWLPEAYILGALCGLLSGSRKLMMSRRSLNNYQKKHPFLARLERYLHKHMNLVLCNSDAIEKELLDEGVQARKIKVIKNGFDIDNFVAKRPRLEMRKTLGIPDDAMAIICVANLIPYKGHSDLLHALALAKHRFNCDWRLLFVGRDGGHKAILEKQAIHHGIDSRVLFLGLRHDVPDLFRASDISVLASHEEGFSNSLIEGMALGLPTIATFVGGNSEAIESKRTGLLVPPGDPGLIADELCRLAENGRLRKSLGQAARSEVLRNRTLRACLDRYEEAYVSVATHFDC